MTNPIFLAFSFTKKLLI